MNIKCLWRVFCPFHKQLVDLESMYWALVLVRIDLTKIVSKIQFFGSTDEEGSLDSGTELPACNV